MSRTEVTRSAGADNRWRPRVEEWAKSGLTAKEFCRRRKLCYWSFCKWRRRLCEAGRDKPSRSPEPEKPRFLPVHVVDRGAELVTPPHAVPGDAAGIELVLRTGRLVRVARGFDPGALAAVIAVAEGVPC